MAGIMLTRMRRSNYSKVPLRMRNKFVDMNTHEPEPGALKISPTPEPSAPPTATVIDASMPLATAPSAACARNVAGPGTADDQETTLTEAMRATVQANKKRAQERRLASKALPPPPPPPPRVMLPPSLRTVVVFARARHSGTAALA